MVGSGIPAGMCRPAHPSTQHTGCVYCTHTQCTVLYAQHTVYAVYTAVCTVYITHCVYCTHSVLCVLYTQHTVCAVCTLLVSLLSFIHVPKPFFSHPSDPVGHWYLLNPLSDRFVCDPVVIRDLHNFLPAIFTGNKPIFYVFVESP